MTDKTFQEFSLILLKPDAYERNLVDVILQAIKDEKLNIVYQKKDTPLGEDASGLSTFIK